MGVVGSSSKPPKGGLRCSERRGAQHAYHAPLGPRPSLPPTNFCRCPPFFIWVLLPVLRVQVPSGPRGWTSKQGGICKAVWPVWRGADSRVWVGSPPRPWPRKQAATKGLPYWATESRVWWPGWASGEPSQAEEKNFGATLIPRILLVLKFAPYKSQSPQVGLQENYSDLALNLKEKKRKMLKYQGFQYALNVLRE